MSFVLSGAMSAPLFYMLNINLLISKLTLGVDWLDLWKIEKKECSRES